MPCALLAHPVFVEEYCLCAGRQLQSLHRGFARSHHLHVECRAAQQRTSTDIDSTWQDCCSVFLTLRQSARRAYPPYPHICFLRAEKACATVTFAIPPVALDMHAFALLDNVNSFFPCWRYRCHAANVVACCAAPFIGAHPPRGLSCHRTLSWLFRFTIHRPQPASVTPAKYHDSCG
jgi:hypothetical protein